VFTSDNGKVTSNMVISRLTATTEASVGWLGFDFDGIFSTNRLYRAMKKFQVY